MNTEPGFRFNLGYYPAPDSWWCSGGSNCLRNPSWQVTVDTEVQSMKNLGVSNVREEFDWPNIAISQPGGSTYSSTAAQDPNCTCYDWSHADYIVNAVSNAGMEVQPIIMMTPNWENATSTNPPTASHFYDFVTAMAKRYKGTIHFWEFWNEPNYTYWTGTPAQMVQDVIIPGYNAIKTVDSTNRAILAGPSSPTTTWIDSLYQNGLTSQFDIVAYHDYCGPGCDVSDGNTYWNEMNKDCLAHGVSSTFCNNVPLWMGEFGDAAPNTTSDPYAYQDFQTAYRAEGTSSSPHLQMVQYYTLSDELPARCCPAQATGENKGYGLVQHDDVTLKSAYPQIQALLGGQANPLPTNTPVPPATSTPVPPATSTPVPPATSTPVLPTPNSASAALQADTFVHPNSSNGWGIASDGNTWALLSGATSPGGSIGIATNEGTISQSVNSVFNILGPTLTTADQDGLVRWSVDSASATAGILLRAQNSSNYYLARYDGANAVQFYKRVAGVRTATTAFSFTPVVGTRYWMRFRAQGTTITIKVWPDGTSEPATWGFTTTDTSLTAPGTVGLYGFASTSGANTFDSFSVR